MSTLISCQGINKFYGSKQALRDVSFELEQGTTTALVGPNGAGKTTLFSILCNYHLPSSGQVSILGHKPGSNALFGQVGALPQDAQLDPRFAIKHQLELYAKLQGYSTKQARIECQRVLEVVDLSQTINERPGALSHGMRKRVSIAQALIGEPKLVMLDEPTAGLDPANAKNIRQLVMALNGQVNFVISSHNLDELEKLCDTVLLLEQGKLSQQKVGQLSTEASRSVTLLLEGNQDNAVEILKQFPSITTVAPLNKQEFILHYDATEHPSFDIELLQLLAKNNVSYRQLTKGLSLEQQLFS